MIRRNNVRQMIEMSNRHKNVLKWGSGETDKHIQMKLEICKYLKKQGEEFYTEAIFVGGKGRGDIVVADREIIIEILDSEREESIITKQYKYPLSLITVKADQEFNEKLIN